MLPRSTLSRLACAFVTAEIGRLRGAGTRPLPAGEWAEAMPLGDEGLGLDSLERLGALGALAEAFESDGAGAGDTAPETVGDWLDWIERGGGGHLTVATSGSTGIAQSCRHAIPDLLAEARYLAGMFADRRRIVAFVPGHHLYGLIWTILLADALGIAASSASIGTALLLRPGDLIVAVPEQWRALLRLTRRFPGDVCGVSSAGPLPDALADVLRAAGLARLIDVYGSSETGGIALRVVPAPAYDLLPRWTLARDGDDWKLADRAGRCVPIPDHVELLGDRGLRPIGRRDGAVQVAGHNVWPGRVAAELLRIGGVAEVAVRLAANGRLKAFVVPQAGIASDALAEALERVAQHRLSDAERPKEFVFGPALPRNAIGKLVDWS